MRQQGEEVTVAIREEITRLEADRLIHTTRTRCNGRCLDACVVIAYPQGLWYKEMTPETGKQLVRKLVSGDRLETNLVYAFEPDAVATGASVTGIDKA